MFHVKRLQTEETAINLFIDISEVQQVAIASLLPCFLVQSPTRTRAYNMLVSRSHSSEPQGVAIASLLPCFLVQSPTSAECHPGGCRDSTRGQEVDPGTRSRMTTFKTRNPQPTTHNSPLTTQNFYIFSFRGPT